MGRRLTFDHTLVHCVAELGADRTVLLTGHVRDAGQYGRIELMAAAPIDRRVSYSGSGLPFPCAAVALDGTPNYAEVPVTPDGAFTARFEWPNSYLSDDATAKVPPSVFVVLTPRVGGRPVLVRLELPDDLPVRTLTDRAERSALGPAFYSAKADVIGIRGAEETMRALAAIKMMRGLA